MATTRHLRIYKITIIRSQIRILFGTRISIETLRNATDHATQLRSAEFSIERLRMYRCHFTMRGSIVAGCDLAASSREDAIREARMLLEKMEVGESTGFEIWMLATLVYTSP
jgi:hypothetical protein